MKHISYPKIESFKNFYKGFKQRRTFVGLEPDGKTPIFEAAILPKIQLRGSVKLHGTNAAVAFQGAEYWTQKRTQASRAGTIDGHFGFHAFVNQNVDDIRLLVHHVRNVYQVDENDIITVYGEWCGPGVQKKVAISQLPTKMFFVFGIKITTPDPEGKKDVAVWLDPAKWDNVEFDNGRIWNIYQFQTWDYVLDMNDPSAARDYFADVVAEVEEQCPVAKFFNIEGIGEGVLWNSYDDTGARVASVKTKGDKHKVAKGEGRKTREIIEISPEKLTNIINFVETVEVNERVHQAIHVLYENVVPGKEKTGEILKWVCQDIYVEESASLIELNLDWDDVKSRVSTKTREQFFKIIEESIFN